jgi:hypothetical protein
MSAVEKVLVEECSASSIIRLTRWNKKGEKNGAVNQTEPPSYSREIEKI